MWAVVRLLDTAVEIYRWILLARILLSWLPNVDPRNQIVRFLYNATEPVLRPFRDLIPPIGGLDLSPILVFFLLNFVRSLLWRILWFII